MTRNGKIARLPKAVQEQLNRRLDDNEPGQRLAAWLNSLPEVQSVITAEFGGLAIREQNLSEWRKGGYRDWQRRQERCDLLRQMQAEAGDLGAIMDGAALNRHLSLTLMADLALAMREVIEQTGDVQERALCLAQLAGKFAQLRREESNADRVRVARERWERELAKAEEYKRSGVRFAPSRALLLQRMYIDMCSSDIGRALAEESTAFGGIDPVSSGPGPLHPTQSDLIRPTPDKANPSVPDGTRN